MVLHEFEVVVSSFGQDAELLGALGIGQFRADHFEQLPAKNFVGLPAVKRLGGPIPGRYAQAFISREDDVVDVGQQMGLVAQVLLGLLAFGNIPDDGLQPAIIEPLDTHLNRNKSLILIAETTFSNDRRSS
jgi:hypothetical protein